jgi:hypothetical protein
MKARPLRIALFTHSVNPRGGIDFAHSVPELLLRFSWTASARRHIALYRRQLQLTPA